MNQDRTIKLLTLAEAAKMLSVSRDWIARRTMHPAESGFSKCVVRFNRRTIRIDHDALLEWLDSRRGKTSEPQTDGQ